ncbi:hypothetical protein [Trabulsiella odontotermitis]|uniref:hypothetical protein n=1 Tax=Trabulsiella odontotermitis TaxID=379893 RepID=UPI00067603B0|nr:hypothetical protein [Trabulsiella odontotermitis]
MNYQTSALWFYRPLALLVVLLAGVLSFFGFSAAFVYLLLAGLVLPVAISMYLHTQKEGEKAWSPKENSEWIVYVNGIPVREDRAVLTNPGFASPEKTRRFFLVSFLFKLAIQVGCLYQLGIQFLAAPTGPVSVIAGIVCLIPLLAVTINTFKHLQQLNQLQFTTIQLATGQSWHQAEFERDGKTTPALEPLLSLK